MNLVLRLTIFIILICLAVCEQSSATSDRLRLIQLAVQDFPVVRCQFSAVDEHGESLAALTPENLTLREGDETITGIQLSPLLPGQERMAIMLVLDRSSSMRGAKLAAAQRASVEFLRYVGPRDLLGIQSFAGHIDPPLAPTVDRAAVRAALARLRPRGETALYDAVQAACACLAHCTADRKAVIVLTDGYDNASAKTANDCRKAALQGGVAIYCIGLGDVAAGAALRQWALDSGGLSFVTNEPAQLPDIYRRIARHVQLRYTLTYHALQTATAWRTVSLTLRQGGRKDTDQRQYLAPYARKPDAPRLPLSLVGMIGATAALDLLLGAAIFRRRRKGVARG